MPLGTHEENNATGKIGFQIWIIDIVHTAVYLNESVQTVAVNFEGGRIRGNQINGPYEVSISVSNETWGFGHAFDCTTDEYDYTHFEQPDLLLSGPVRLKVDAIELAREKAEELDIVVGEVNHTRIRIDQNHEIWFIEFKGGEFDEVFMIYGEDDIKHWTMDGRRPKGVYVPFIGAAGTGCGAGLCGFADKRQAVEMAVTGLNLWIRKLGEQDGETCGFVEKGSMKLFLSILRYINEVI